MLAGELMGGIKTKNRGSQETSLVFDLRTLLATPQGFYDELWRQVSKDDFDNIQVLFHNINISSHNISKYLYKFMNNNGFRKPFKAELNQYDVNLCKTQRRSSSNVSSSLKNHCFAIFSVHWDIISNIDNVHSVDDILTRVAISHCFIKNVKKSFKMHSMLFQRFLHREFGKYIDKRTYKALKTFLSLIYDRMIIIAEQHTASENLEMVTKAMEDQKHLIQNKVDKLSTLSEIYKNPVRTVKSEYSLLKINNTAYPGTSKGSAQKSHTKSKNQK